MEDFEQKSELVDVNAYPDCRAQHSLWRGVEGIGASGEAVAAVAVPRGSRGGGGRRGQISHLEKYRRLVTV